MMISIREAIEEETAFKCPACSTGIEFVEDVDLGGVDTLSVRCGDCGHEEDFQDFDKRVLETAEGRMRSLWDEDYS